MSLRAELTGESSGMPGFAVLLPGGWQATDADFSDTTDRMDAALRGFPESTRVQLRARIEAMLASAQTESSKTRIARVFAPSGLAPEDYVPVTLVASWLTAPSGGSIHDVGAGLIARQGATPLDAAGSVLTWAADQASLIEGGQVQVAGNGYLLPVPHRTDTALMFRSQILRSAGGVSIPDEGIAAMSSVCDAIVASVRWRRAA